MTDFETVHTLGRRVKYFSVNLYTARIKSVIYKTTWIHKTHFRGEKNDNKRTIYFTLDLFFPQELLASNFLVQQKFTSVFCIQIYKLKLFLGSCSLYKYPRIIEGTKPKQNLVCKITRVQNSCRFDGKQYDRYGCLCASTDVGNGEFAPVIAMVATAQLTQKVETCSLKMTDSIKQCLYTSIHYIKFSLNQLHRILGIKDNADISIITQKSWTVTQSDINYCTGAQRSGVSVTCTAPTCCYFASFQ
jgi:hypothetical protein